MPELRVGAPVVSFVLLAACCRVFYRVPMRSPTVRFAALILPLIIVCVLLACSTLPRGVRSPSDRGHEWNEYRTEHVVLQTNLSDKEARRAIYQFEQRYAILAHALWGVDSPSRVRTRVVAFRDGASFHMFRPSAAGAVFQHQLIVDPDDLPTVVMYGSPTEHTYSVWQHELTHRFLHYAMGPMPVWFNEGMAAYYQGLEIRDGAWVVGHRSVVQPGRVPSIRQLMALEPAEFYASRNEGKNVDYDARRETTRNYVGSQMVIHMLLHSTDEYRLAFEDALARIAGGTSVDQSMRELGNTVGWDKWESDYQDHIAENFQAYRMGQGRPARTAPFEKLRLEGLETEPMTDSRIYTLFAMLGGFLDDDTHTSAHFAQRAVDSDPRDAEAHLVAALLTTRSDVDQARAGVERARELDPKHLGVQRGLLELLPDELDQDQVKAFKSVADNLAARAESARQLNAAARFYASHGFSGRAVSVIEQSTQFDPRCWQCYLTYSMALARLRQYDAAIAAHREALSIVAEFAPAELVGRLEAELAELEEQRTTVEGDGSEPADEG